MSDLNPEYAPRRPPANGSEFMGSSPGWFGGVAGPVMRQQPAQPRSDSYQYVDINDMIDIMTA